MGLSGVHAKGGRAAFRCCRDIRQALPHSGEFLATLPAMEPCSSHLPVFHPHHTDSSISPFPIIKLEGVESADSGFSMSIKDFAQMVRDVHNAKKIMEGPDYTLTKGEKSSMVFRRSIFAVKNIKEGDKFTEENIRIIRPGYGMKPKYYGETIGKRAACDIRRGMPIKEDYIRG